MDFSAQEAKYGSLTPKKKTSGRGGFLTSLISEGLGTVGGIGGLALGGPVGAAAGAGILGGLGSALEQKVRDNKVNVGKAVQSGALEGLFAGGPFKLVKAGKLALQGGEKLAAKEIGEKVAERGLFSRIRGKVQDEATKSMLRASPSTYTKAAEGGHELVKVGKKWLPQLGSTYKEIEKKFPELIKGEEAVIKANAKVAGSNIRIGGEEIVKALETQAKLIKGPIGSEDKVRALEKLIDKAKTGYKNGITVKEALKRLRQANKNWGAAVINTDTKSAVLTAAQKIEANTLRKVLKQSIPEIGGALDNQSELIVLRNVLKSARGKAESKGFQQLPQGVVKLFGDILGSQKISGKIAAKSGEEVAARSGILGRVIPMAGRVGAGSVLSSVTSGANGVETPPPQDLTEASGDNQESGQGDQGGMLKKSLLVAMLADMQGGGKNVGGLSTIYKLLGEQGKASQQAGKAQSASAIIDNLENVFNASGGARGPIAGRGTLLGAVAGGGNQTAKSYQDLRSAYTAQISRALGEVGVLTDKDREVIQKAIPSINDSPAAAKIKLDTLRQILQDIQSKGATNPSSSGIGIDELVGAMGGI